MSHTILTKTHTFSTSAGSLIPSILKPIICISVLALSACTSYRDIPANTPEPTVLQHMGQPNYSCEKADGTRRLIWTTQPNGQYAYATNISKDGFADKVVSILNNENFHKLDHGEWTQHDVVCEFGPPAEIGRIGLGEKNEVVWTYRYKQINHWNNLMYIYFGRNGDKVTHYHSAPDPRYDPDNFLFFD